ncbi:hypothetical protein [Nocardiopsis sp. FIRDI 009]|uniref:hypothetical protein n=1 Tax=Nocardiopsis sp. FIRDI 009 TaxID=714197 RepID=UPI000E23E857|nr:hypothetical protein [Nocardiopsis sp. FIRDI 009]
MNPDRDRANSTTSRGALRSEPASNGDAGSYSTANCTNSAPRRPANINPMSSPALTPAEATTNTPAHTDAVRRARADTRPTAPTPEEVVTAPPPKDATRTR